MSTVKTESDASELKSLLREAEKALSHTSGEAGEKFDELRERLRDALSHGRYSFDNIRSETVRRAKQADTLVRDNPYYAAGIAAGIGALIGILVSRSCSSR
jgi:ElaB protein